jgi:hypothetical protein
MPQERSDRYMVSRLVADGWVGGRAEGNVGVRTNVSSIISAALSTQMNGNSYPCNAKPVRFQTYDCFRSVPQRSPNCVLVATHSQLSD